MILDESQFGQFGHFKNFEYKIRKCGFGESTEPTSAQLEIFPKISNN